MIYEEYLHSSKSDLGFMRNVRLLEKSNQTQLLKMLNGTKEIPASKKELIDRERACRQLIHKSRPLVEATDLFLLEKLLDHPTAVERLQTITAFLKELKLLPPKSEFEVHTNFLRQLSSNRRRYESIHPGLSLTEEFPDEVGEELADAIGKELKWLNQASNTLLLPRFAANLALDIPYFITPFTHPRGESKSIEEVDFISRFQKVMKTFKKWDEKDQLKERPVFKQYADFEQKLLKKSVSGAPRSFNKAQNNLLRVGYNEVARESGIATPTQPKNSSQKITVQNFQLPLLDIPLKNQKLTSMRSVGQNDLHPAWSVAPAPADQNHTDGVVFGYDARDGSSPVILDRFSWETGHIAIMGNTGSGKSYSAKLHVLRAADRYDDVQFRLVDPTGEYGAIADAIAGDVKRWTSGEGAQDLTKLIDAVQEAYRDGCQHNGRTIVVIDEGHRLLRTDEGRIVVSQLIREGRDQGIAATLITQTASDFIQSQEGRNILRNMNGYVFMRHSDMDTGVQEFFNLSDGEMTQLRNLRTGTVGGFSEALIRGPVNKTLHIVSTDQEHAVITNDSETDTEIKSMSDNDGKNPAVGGSTRITGCSRDGHIGRHPVDVRNSKLPGPGSLSPLQQQYRLQNEWDFNGDGANYPYHNPESIPDSIDEGVVRRRPVSRVFDRAAIETEVFQKSPKVDNFGGVVYVDKGDTILSINNELADISITPSITYDEFWKYNYMMNNLINQLMSSHRPEKEPNIQCPLCDYFDQIHPKKNNKPCDWHDYVKATKDIQQEFQATEVALEDDLRGYLNSVQYGIGD